MGKIILKNYTLLSRDEHIQLLEIRNESYVRENSLNSEVILLDDHMKWAERLNFNMDKHYFAVFFEGEIIGAINVFDITIKIKWGLFFKKEASLMIKTLVPIYFLEYVLRTYNVDYLYLEALKHNDNAISFDKNLGFVICDEDENKTTMKMSKEMFERAKQAPFLKRIIKKMNNYTFVMENK